MRDRKCHVFKNTMAQCCMQAIDGDPLLFFCSPPFSSSSIAIEVLDPFLLCPLSFGFVVFWRDAMGSDGGWNGIGRDGIGNAV